MTTLEAALATLQDHPRAYFALQLFVLAVLALIAHRLAKAMLLRFIRPAVQLSPARWDDALLGRGVISRLAHVAPALVVYFGSVVLPAVPDGSVIVIRRIVTIYLVVAVTAAVARLLGAIGDAYEQYDLERAQVRPIKSYLQAGRILVWLIASIFISAVLFDRDPLLILSGLGALTAVLLLIFRDTIQSFVAGVQISSHDLLHLGDWIEVPQFNANGHAIDLSLHTVKVQNLDNSITSIPTWRLINESFRNWRGMFDSGARLIQRAVLLDQTSICFLGIADWDALQRFPLLNEYLTRKRAEIVISGRGDYSTMQISTNAGMFRAYVRAYLDAHPRVRHDMDVRVRQLPLGPTGMPLEIYCFTVTDGEQYENVQAEIFEHLLSILPEFGLRIFQQPISQRASDGRSRLQATEAEHLSLARH